MVAANLSARNPCSRVQICCPVCAGMAGHAHAAFQQPLKPTARTFEPIGTPRVVQCLRKKLSALASHTGTHTSYSCCFQQWRILCEHRQDDVFPRLCRASGRLVRHSHRTRTGGFAVPLCRPSAPDGHRLRHSVGCLPIDLLGS